MPSSAKPIRTPAESFAALPDPGQAISLDDLVEQLRRLKVWSGNPSYERITDRINEAWKKTGRPLSELARKNTVADCFKAGRRRINTDLVLAVVQSLHPDVGYVSQWGQALRVVDGETHGASQVRVQDTLPPDVPEFGGRKAELDQLFRSLQHAQQAGGAFATFAVDGLAGVGKTQLAVHFGHRLVREQFVARVLFVNLRGFHPDQTQPPADPSAVLDGFLRLLGTPGQQIPHDLPARIAAFRERLAGTRTLVILDNAAGAEQVRPLLPATPGCLALITSRRHLTSLHSTTHLTLNVLTRVEAVEFLHRATVKIAAGSDPHALARIAECCGYLPLALSLVAGHIRATAGWTLTDQADRLDERHRIGRLDTGVEGALDLSYQDLPTAPRRLLRLAALHPGQDLDVHASAALADTDLSTAQDALRHLCGDFLLQETAPGRYSLHDLVRAYALGRVRDEEPPPQRRAALTRLFDYYLANTLRAADAAYPSQQQPRRTSPKTPLPAPHQNGHGGDEWWLHIELANLLAAAEDAARNDLPEHTWQFAATLQRHLLIRGHYHEAQALHRNALDLARRVGNHLAEMQALNSLGDVHRLLGLHRQAEHEFRQALDIAQKTGVLAGELSARTGLGKVHRMLAKHTQAESELRQALQIAQNIGGDAAILDVLQSLGHVHRMLGKYKLAGDHYQQALDIAQDHDDRTSEQAALSGLGGAHLMQGNFEPAGEHYLRALRIAQSIGVPAGEQVALHGLGEVHRLLGRYDEAARCYQQGLKYAKEHGSGNWMFEARQGLGRLRHDTGHPRMALTHHERALHHATVLDQPADQARAHDGLARAYSALSQPNLACRHWQHALEILTSLGAEHTSELEASTDNIRANLAKERNTKLHSSLTNEPALQMRSSLRRQPTASRDPL